MREVNKEEGGGLGGWGLQGGQQSLGAISKLKETHPEKRKREKGSRRLWAWIKQNETKTPQATEEKTSPLEKFTYTWSWGSQSSVCATWTRREVSETNKPKRDGFFFFSRALTRHAFTLLKTWYEKKKRCRRRKKKRNKKRLQWEENEQINKTWWKCSRLT